MWYDKDKQQYLNGCQYIQDNNLCWTWSEPEEFYSKFCVDNTIKFIRYSFRKYGQPKLSKPKELKDVKQSFSVNYNPKCKCQGFIKDNDVWIKHRDYFSSIFKPSDNDIGRPTEYILNKYFNKSRSLKSFIYPDCWSSVILRNEAWICIKNLLLHINEFELDIRDDILHKQEQYEKFKKNELLSSDMERFWENVIKKVKESKDGKIS